MIPINMFNIALVMILVMALVHFAKQERKLVGNNGRMQFDIDEILNALKGFKDEDDGKGESEPLDDGDNLDGLVVNTELNSEEAMDEVIKHMNLPDIPDWAAEAIKDMNAIGRAQVTKFLFGDGTLLPDGPEMDDDFRREYLEHLKKFNAGFRGNFDDREEFAERVIPLAKALVLEASRMASPVIVLGCVYNGDERRELFLVANDDPVAHQKRDPLGDALVSGLSDDHWAMLVKVATEKMAQADGLAQAKRVLRDMLEALDEM